MISMISIEEARSLISARARPGPPVSMASSDALGYVLAKDVSSDIDSPPHDKSLMDGYAVVAADLRGGEAELTVLEEITAGAVPTKRVTPGNATRIMTGAAIPAGADAVVMIEQTELCGGRPETVRIRGADVRPGQHILRRGTSLRSNEMVLRAGRLIRPSEVGLLAEIGATRVAVYPRPSVAVMPTGDELAPPDTRPAAGQIRNSNGPMLRALVTRAGGRAVELEAGRDDEEHLCPLIRRGLEEDVLVLSGGVSAGVRDLAPRALQRVGVREVFHRVRLKPGKPLWFGVWENSGREKLVFGLPGNPVSTLVCFELFVRPALAELAGHQPVTLEPRQAKLGREHVHRGDRPTFFPSTLCCREGQLIVEPLPWQGSADLRTLSDANCLAYFPAGDRVFEAGETLDVHPL